MTMDFAASSVRFTAAVVEMSGLGAPFCTVSPSTILANGVALLGSTLPDATAGGYGANIIDTSRAWPRATNCLVP